MRSASLLLLSSIYMRSASRRRYWRFSAAPAAMVFYMVHGEGEIVIGGVMVAVKAHQLCFIPAGATVEIALQPGFCQYYVMFLREIRLTGSAGANMRAHTARRQQGGGFSARLIRHRPELYEQMREIHRLYWTEPAGTYESHALLQTFLHAIFSHEPGLAPPARASAEADDGIERSVAYMRRHYSAKIKLETLAQLSGLTPTSYSREFKKKLGVSPTDYLTACRIGAAKQLLAERAYSVKQVSVESGFGNEFYFSRIFKREVGLSPTLYMKRSVMRIAVSSNFRFEDTLQSLGIEPVLATNCHKGKTMSQAEHQLMLAERLAAIREAGPELILCDHYHQPYLEQLKEIAPTVVIGLSMDWKVMHRQIAELVGRERVAERNLRTLDDRLTDARMLLSERLRSRTVTFLRVVHKLIRIQGSSQHPLNDLLYSELGLAPGYCVPANIKHVEFSPQKYPSMDTDLLFIQNNYFHPEDESVFRHIASTPQWHNIRAVRNGDALFVDNWISKSWSPAGRSGIIDELLELAMH